MKQGVIKNLKYKQQYELPPKKKQKHKQTKIEKKKQNQNQNRTEQNKTRVTSGAPER